MTDRKTRILAFAEQIGGEGRDATAKAIARDWLTETGEITAEGEALLDSLTDQVGNRSVFRGA